jgi:signal peptidase
MEPNLPRGSVAFISTEAGPRAIHVGDVITFSVASESGTLVTHRVVGIEDQDGNLAFQTRGDDNNGVDPWRVLPSDVVGRLQLFVPGVGYVISAAGLPAARGAVMVLLAISFGFQLLRHALKRPARAQVAATTA